MIIKDIIEDISRTLLVRYFCGTSDTSDTANSNDASKTSASVTRLWVISFYIWFMLYHILISSYLFPFQPIFLYYFQTVFEYFRLTALIKNYWIWTQIDLQYSYKITLTFYTKARRDNNSICICPFSLNIDHKLTHLVLVFVDDLSRALSIRQNRVNRFKLIQIRASTGISLNSIAAWSRAQPTISI